MSFLDEIKRAGELKMAFMRWFATVEHKAPMKASVGINGEMVFKPRSYLDPLNGAEFSAALVRIDQIFHAKPGTPEGFKLEALPIAAEAYDKAHA